MKHIIFHMTFFHYFHINEYLFVFHGFVDNLNHGNYFLLYKKWQKIKIKINEWKIII